MDIDWQRIVMGDSMPSAGPSRTRKGQPTAHPRPPLRPLEHGSATARNVPQNGTASFLAPSSSPIGSGNVSPLPSSDNSSSQTSQTRSKPGKTRSVEMDVKVLYTFESNPRATMVAHLGRAANVTIVPLKRRRANSAMAKATSLFGKVKLTACLRALLSASPELVMDSKKDFVLYATDPIESFRAAQRKQNSAGRPDLSSPSKASSGHPAAFMVGKGFLSRALAEIDDNVSFVHGRVRSEYADDDDDDDDDDEEDSQGGDDDDDDDGLDGKILEVVLKLKEAPVTTRDQYEDRVRALQDTKVEKSLPAATTVQPADANSSNGDHQESSGNKIDSARNATPQEQLLQLLQALQSQTDNGDKDKHVSFSEAPESGNAVARDSKACTSAQESNAGPDVLGQLLRSFTGPSSVNASAGPSHKTDERKAKSSPAPELERRQSHRNSATQRRSTGVPSRTGMQAQSDAGSPILGGLTPGYEIDYHSSGPSPAYSTASATPMASTSWQGDHHSSETSKHPETRLSDNAKSLGAHRHKQCCYNCGITSQSSWRHLALPDESTVRFREGSSIVDHGKRLFRSCNACGLYYQKKDGLSRPEHVWRQAQKERSSKGGSASGQETAADSDAADDEGPDSTTVATRARSGGIARTLSEACARDSQRLSSKTSDKRNVDEGSTGEETSSKQKTNLADQVRIRRSAPARRMLDFESARMKDIVLDGEGNWRTKRSILENPAGRRPGRPKGIKTGEGFGRTRNEINQQRREAQRKAKEAAAALNGPATSPAPTKKQNVAGTQRPAIPASSPVRPSTCAMNALQSKTPIGVGKVRYGAPTYLMNSSPGTALQTVMDEADTDWRALFGMSPRRSPRKNPSGVHAQVNPYASMSQASPAKKHDTGLDSLLMSMTSSSPLTRGRLRSGNFGWALNSSDEAFEGMKGEESSTITSPFSPSPSRSKPGSAKRRHNAMPMELEAGPSATIQERAAKRQKQHDEAQLVASHEASIAPMLEDDDEGMPGSPTLGRSQRLDKKRSTQTERSINSPVSHGLVPGLSTQSSGVGAFTNDWSRTASMREMFPTPSPNKNWPRSPSHVSWESPTAWALRDPTPSPQKPDKTEVTQPGAPEAGSKHAQDEAHDQQENGAAKSSTLEVPKASGQVVHRKPLPATVEDATPSDASNHSPADENEDEDDEDDCALEIDPNDGASMKALMDMFEDPYGLLKASGLTAGKKVPEGAQRVPSKQSTSGNDVQVDHASHIELFKGFDFAQHLDFFNENGGNGIAARVDPSAASHLLPLPNAPVQIEGKGRHHQSTSQPEKDAAGSHLDQEKETTSADNNQNANFAMWLNDNKLNALWSNGNEQHNCQAQASADHP